MNSGNVALVFLDGLSLAAPALSLPPLRINADPIATGGFFAWHS
jgi:hypothetical protein